MANSDLDPPPDPRDSPDSPEDNEPDTVATPEGDSPPFPVPPGMQIPSSIDTNKL